MSSTTMIVGRLTRDPEMSTTNSGKVVTKASVAVRRRFKPTDGSNDADFYNVVVWGQPAEYLSNYGAKGRDVAITGRMESRTYNHKEGHKVTAWELIADQVTLVGGVRDDAQGSPKPTTPKQEEYDPFADD
jgi:single-strand DNA-binding protein